MKNKNFIFLGKDKRLKNIFDTLINKYPFCTFYHFDKVTFDNIKTVFNDKKFENILIFEFSTEQKLIINIVSKFKNCTVFCFQASDKLLQITQKHNIHVFQFATNIDFNIKNTNYSIEGIIAQIIKNTDFALYESQILIFGYGKLGKRLSYILKAFGANITIGIRNLDNLKEENNQINFYSIKEALDKISNYDIIINTIPFEYIKNLHIDKLKNNALLVEIASGINFDNNYAKLNHKTLISHNIPTVFSMKSATNIMLEFIEKNLVKEAV